MSDRARTFYFQALSAIEAGSHERALDLLRRAKVTVGDDRGLLCQILTEMVKIAALAGCAAEGDIWRRQLAQHAPEPTYGHNDFSASSSSTYVRSRRSGGGFLKVMAACTVLAVFCGGLWLWHWATHQTMTEVIDVAVEGEKRIVSALPVPRLPELKFDNASGDARSLVAPIVAPVLKAADRERESHLRECVGLALWIQDYQGTYEGRPYHTEQPLDFGTAFAVNRGGILLTSRHLAKGVEGPIAETIGDGLDVPIQHRQGSPRLRICIGSDPGRHVDATVVYQSRQYDVAVINIPEQQFETYFELADAEPTVRQSVQAYGYPYPAIKALQESNRDQQLRRGIDNSKATGILSYFDQLSPDVFNAMESAGTVLANNVPVNGAQYIQFDARISKGNSGGPLLSAESGLVVGIVSMVQVDGNANSAGPGYAIAIRQLRNELQDYLP